MLHVSCCTFVLLLFLLGGEEVGVRGARKGGGSVFIENPTRGGVWGGQNRVDLSFCVLFYSIWGSQDTQMLGNTARKMSLSHPLL